MKQILTIFLLFFAFSLHSFSQEEKEEKQKDTIKEIIKEILTLQFSDDNKYVLDDNKKQIWEVKCFMLYKAEITKELNDIYQNYSIQTEFETENMFEKRLQNDRQIKIDIILKYKNRHENKLREKIKNSHEFVNLKIDFLGMYNAEKQVYPITINRITKDISIPIKEAKALKQNLQDVEVKGEKQLSKDGETFDIFNVKIIHPTMKKTYKFGEQRKAYYK